MGAIAMGVFTYFPHSKQADALAQAKRVPIEAVTAARGIKLDGKGVEREGPCPICGGTDRFSINTGKQLFNCRICETGGDVIDLVCFLDDCDTATAIATLNGTKLQRSPQRKTRAPDNGPPPASDDFWREIWKQAVSPTGTDVQRFLENRRVWDLLPAGAVGEVIRFHPHCPFGKGVRLPCMVALVRDIKSNAPQAIYRTAIEREADGSIRTKGVRRLSLGSTKGGAIKLTDNADVTTCLGTGEGVESTLSMRRTPEFGASPAWALMYASAIGDLPVLAGIEVLWIAVDHDEMDERTGRYPGQEAATACSDRWTSAGREVHRLMSDTPGTDLNDPGVVP
jgi:Toprim domain/Zinc-binding domain of primase-helicase